MERITQSILLIRGQKVMLDADLAVLYGVETRAVRRNIERFPDDFMFQLTNHELKDLRCQFDTSSQWGGRRYAAINLRHGHLLSKYQSQW